MSTKTTRSTDFSSVPKEIHSASVTEVQRGNDIRNLSLCILTEITRLTGCGQKCFSS
jgi:hypothetical protein